jgi:hypothetical protein
LPFNSTQARAAAHAAHAKHGGHAMTRKARAKFFSRFEDEVDPDRVLPEDERRRRAESARRAHMTKLSMKAAKKRSAMQQASQAKEAS